MMRKVLLTLSLLIFCQFTLADILEVKESFTVKADSQASMITVLGPQHDASNLLPDVQCQLSHNNRGFDREISSGAKFTIYESSPAEKVDEKSQTQFFTQNLRMILGGYLQDKNPKTLKELDLLIESGGQKRTSNWAEVYKYKVYIKSEKSTSTSIIVCLTTENDWDEDKLFSMIDIFTIFALVTDF
ncbi:hypothetical protein N9W41_00525 [bacterium]|nr:hypothetical protein [bacterium]